MPFALAPLPFLAATLSAVSAPHSRSVGETPFAPLLDPPGAQKTAVLFAPGEISTGEYESHPCFSADGKTLYYLKSTPQFDHWTIVVSKLENGRWTKPEVAPFS